MIMEIKPVDPHRVRIALDAADLRRLGIDYRDLIEGSPALGPVLGSLFQLAARRAGFSDTGRRILIEVYPAPDGGCMLCFSGLGDTPVRYRPLWESLEPCLFAFEDADALFAGCRALWRLMPGKSGVSSLYWAGWAGAFILSVCPQELPPGRVCTLLGEYARLIGRGRLREAVLKEHACLLCGENAVAALAAL